MSSPLYLELDGISFQIRSRVILPLTDPDRSITVSKGSALRAMRATGCVMLRYTSDFDSPRETNFWHVINDRFVPLEQRSGARRRKIRRGLERFLVERVSATEFLQEAYPVHAAAQAGYGKPAQSPHGWQADILAMAGHREYWLARDRQTLRAAAYCATNVFDRSCLYSAVKYDPAALTHFVSYALIYTMDAHYLAERRLSFVSNGERTLSHPSSAHDFLIRELSFRKAYCNLNVIFRPGIDVLAHVGLWLLRMHLPLPPLALLARHRMLAVDSKPAGGDTTASDRGRGLDHPDKLATPLAAGQLAEGSRRPPHLLGAPILADLAELEQLMLCVCPI